MYRRVLLPLDGSAIAEQALPYAVEQAEWCRAELILLQVINPLPNGAGQWALDAGWIPEEAGEWARDYLESLASQIRTRGIHVKGVVSLGSAHEAITQYAESQDIGLIVICSRGSSGPSRWLMGSVADRVVRGATVPVLLVPGQAEKARARTRGR